MSYENAPATAMLATHCAVCRRPLVDAVSVETGIGPDCRAKYGYGEAQAEAYWTAALSTLVGLEVASAVETAADAHQAANILVRHIAASDRVGPAYEAMVKALHELGFRTLATKIATRCAGVIVERDGDDLLVRAPYSAEANRDWYALGGRFAKKPFPHRRVPATEANRRALWTLLQRHYAGVLMVGPEGLRAIPQLPARPQPGRQACDGCSGDGCYHFARGGVGRCFRCAGKGYQTADDVARNRAYSAHRAA